MPASPPPSFTTTPASGCPKHDWESQGQIGLDEARNFVPGALLKLHGALKHEAERQ